MQLPVLLVIAAINHYSKIVEFTLDLNHEVFLRAAPAEEEMSPIQVDAKFPRHSTLLDRAIESTLVLCCDILYKQLVIASHDLSSTRWRVTNVLIYLDCLQLELGHTEYA